MRDESQEAELTWSSIELSAFMSSSESDHSVTSRLLRSRSKLVLLGSTLVPRWRPHRNTTCAGDLPSFSAICTNSEWCQSDSTSIVKLCGTRCAYPSCPLIWNSRVGDTTRRVIFLINAFGPQSSMIQSRTWRHVSTEIQRRTLKCTRIRWPTTRCITASRHTIGRWYTGSIIKTVQSWDTDEAEKYP